MKEKYEEMKMEVVAFEEDIWTLQGNIQGNAIDNPSNLQTVTLTDTPTVERVK